MRRNASTRSLLDPALIATLVGRMDACAADARTPVIVGLSGLQGSGKSTLAAALVAACRRRSIDALAFSLDDAYFGRRERQRLARTVHPLLATRGVPGTHSTDLLERTFDGLALASKSAPACVPRFDKGRDSRLPPSRWRRIAQAPRIILFEGWCVGVPAQPGVELRDAVNALERDEDSDGHWRAFVNTQLGNPYSRLWRRLDLLIELKAPSFEIVAEWRGQQEHALRRSGASRAMKGPQLTRFIAHFERISRHSLRTLSSIADISLTLDASRAVSAVMMDAATRA